MQARKEEGRSRKSSTAKDARRSQAKPAAKTKPKATAAVGKVAAGKVKASEKKTAKTKIVAKEKTKVATKRVAVVEKAKPAASKVQAVAKPLSKSNAKASKPADGKATETKVSEAKAAEAKAIAKNGVKPSSAPRSAREAKNGRPHETELSLKQAAASKAADKNAIANATAKIPGVPRAGEDRLLSDRGPRTDDSKTEIKVPVARVSPQFNVGETVVYPARGVAEIMAIEDKEIGGRRQSFFVLRVHDTEQKILVPVLNAAENGLRRPISEAEVREIFRILKVTDIPLDTQTWNRRYRGFVEKLATGSVFSVAEVLRDLSRVKVVKDGLSFSERQMLERARTLIVKEIAVARSQAEDQVREQIEAIFVAN